MVKNNDEKLNAIANQWDFSGYPTHRLIRSSDFDYSVVENTSELNNSFLFIGDSHSYQYWNSIGDFVESNEEKVYLTNIYVV